MHHGRNPQHIDKNYAGVLIIDKPFGTLSPRETVIYGITKPVNSFNPSKVTFFWGEWRDMFAEVTATGLSVKQRLHILFAPPSAV